MQETDVDIEKLDAMDPQELLRHAFGEFGTRAAIGTSLQKTGIVMIDMASRVDLPFRVFFIDTLCNYDETYELLEEVQQRYGITIERFMPEPEQIESLNRSVGQYAHYLARPLCCRVRKHLPLQKALGTLDVWISGLRMDQSSHRSDNTCKAQWVRDDSGRHILKLNPLVDWSADDVDSYTAEHKLPCNKLYEFVSKYGERYTVIGCKQCHIPIRKELDPRAGKFPWEQGKKECGLHEHGSGI